MADAEQGGGHGGLYAILIIIVILMVGAILYFGNVIGTRGGDTPDRIEADIEIETPNVPDPEGGRGEGR